MQLPRSSTIRIVGMIMLAAALTACGPKAKAIQENQKVALELQAVHDHAVAIVTITEQAGSNNAALRDHLQDLRDPAGLIEKALQGLGWLAALVVVAVIAIALMHWRSIPCSLAKRMIKPV